MRYMDDGGPPARMAEGLALRIARLLAANGVRMHAAMDEEFERWELILTSQEPLRNGAYVYTSIPCHPHAWACMSDTVLTGTILTPMIEAIRQARETLEVHLYDPSQ